MKLSGLISPGTWELIERLRPHLDVIIDLYDASLAPTLPDPTDAAGRALRRLLQNDSAGAARERFATALRTANTQLFTVGGLRVGLFPLRHARMVVGILAAAHAAERPAEAGRKPADSRPETDEALRRGEPADSRPQRHEAPRRGKLEPGDDQQGVAADTASGFDLDAISTRIERLGWSLRATIESDIETHAQLSDEQQRSRWLAATLRFFEHLYSCHDEKSLAGALVQAAGIWGDVDARVYRRGVDGDYVLHTALPAIEAAASPRRIAGNALRGITLPTRITSIAELEQLGWRDAPGEVLLMAISPPDWLLAVGGAVDPTYERVLNVACRTLATRLDEVGERQLERLRADLAARLGRSDLKPPAQAAAALAHIAGAAGATRAHLLASDTIAGGPLRVLAAVGGTTIAGDGPASHDIELQPAVTPTRIALPIDSGNERQALVEFRTVAHQPFGPDAVRVAQAGVECLALWLAGALRSLSFAGLVPAEAPSGGFEGRIAQELERARRFDLEVGLLVVDTDPSFATRHALVLEPILAAVRLQLRASDMLGRLGDGAIAGLLVQTGAAGVNAAAARVERQLAWIAADGRVPHPVVGRAAYPAIAESVHALVAAAHEDRTRRATAMKHELPG